MSGSGGMLLVGGLITGPGMRGRGGMLLVGGFTTGPGIRGRGTWEDEVSVVFMDTLDQ